MSCKHKIVPELVQVTDDGENINVTCECGVNGTVHVDDLSAKWDYFTPEIPTHRKIPDGKTVNHTHMSGAGGTIECSSNGNVLDLRCPPHYKIVVRPSGDDPHLVRVWVEPIR